MMGLLRNAPVLERRGIGSPVFLEGNESSVTGIGASHIEDFEPVGFGLLDRLPEEEGGSAQLAMVGVAAAVLVGDGVFEGESEHGGDRVSVFIGHANTEVLAKLGDEGFKPSQRLWRNAMAAAGDGEQPVKVVQEDGGRSLAEVDFLPLGAPDALLNRGLVEAAVENIGVVGAQNGGAGRLEDDGADLEILRFPFRNALPDAGEAVAIGGGLVEERLAVVREGDRNEPASGEPGVDLAKSQAVGQRNAGG
jgi:hypothetical protein